MGVEVEPGQPREVVRAISELLEEPGRELDTWWADGVAAALAPFQGDATAPPRRTRGAERA